MRKKYFRATSIFLVAISLFIIQASPTNAVRCSYGTPELISADLNVNPGCIRDHEGNLLDYCNYTLEYYITDGPYCIPGLILAIENPCLIDGYTCSSVKPINLCDSEYWVTTSYKKAVVFTPWLCPMDDCFWGDCSVFYPECTIGIAYCPDN